jgi:hypothetical protein
MKEKFLIIFWSAIVVTGLLAFFAVIAYDQNAAH